MWDALFTNQAEWSAASAADRNGFFEKYATSVGVKLEKFRTDYASEAVSKKIKFDQALGKVAGVTGTPTLFINGKQVDGGKINSTEGIKTQIDEALKEVE
jgi:protein-disulfide isomerase